MAITLVGVLASFGITTTGAARVVSEEGVTPKTVKIGFIFSETGIAGSTFHNSGKAFQARIDRQNAAGGVNGRKIEVEAIDDGGAVNNKQASEDLVQNRHVFMVVNNSSFAFTSYRFFLENGVPMIGGGYDGVYYGTPGNEDIISALGNIAGIEGVVYSGLPELMKKMGAKKVAALAYGVSASSSAAATNLQKFAVPKAGLEAVYLNTAVPFGSTDVGPLVLGIKNSGADAVYLPMVASTNLAVVTGLQQNGVKMKSTVLATGYGQNLLDQPAAKTLTPDVVLNTGTGWEPVELKTKATKQFQADLKKYAHYTGVPDFGMYTGYITAELAILGLEQAGKDPTRRGFIDGLRALGTYDQAGLACRPIDISLENYGKPPPTTCAYYVKVDHGRFVPFPKNGKPVFGKLIRESTAGVETKPSP